MNVEANGVVPGHQWIEVAGYSLVFQRVALSTETPTGTQLAAAVGFGPERQWTVLELLVGGEMEDIRPDEVVNLRESTGRFVIVESDRSYRLTLDGVRSDWPCRVISGGQLRRLGTVPTESEVYLSLPGPVERVIQDHDLVDLDEPGVEAFLTRRRRWRLNVQGVMLVVHEPTIVVRDAIRAAGFDPCQDWIAILRVKGAPKQEVGLDFVIDLRTHGIEKLRLTPREVINGEGPTGPRRMFALLEVDERFLNGLGFRWETVIDGASRGQARRWLLIHDYPPPQGFTTERTLLALEIPPTYPNAQIDMFYTNPPLALATGRPIDRTQVSARIAGVDFNGWSRHRGPQSQWDPASDNVMTHLALVESAMAKEVSE